MTYCPITAAYKDFNALRTEAVPGSPQINADQHAPQKRRFNPGRRAGGECFVYFARCEGFVKIGIARDPLKRAQDLNVACPFPVVLEAVMVGDESAERALHHRFRRIRHKGEWFRCEGDLAALVDALRPCTSARRCRTKADLWFERSPGGSNPQALRTAEARAADAEYADEAAV